MCISLSQSHPSSSPQFTAAGSGSSERREERSQVSDEDGKELGSKPFSEDAVGSRLGPAVSCTRASDCLSLSTLALDCDRKTLDRQTKPPPSKDETALSRVPRGLPALPGGVGPRYLVTTEGRWCFLPPLQHRLAILLVGFRKPPPNSTLALKFSSQELLLKKLKCGLVCIVDKESYLSFQSTKNVEAIKSSATATVPHPVPQRCTLRAFRVEKTRMLVLDS